MSVPRQHFRQTVAVLVAVATTVVVSELLTLSGSDTILIGTAMMGIALLLTLQPSA